MGRDILRVRLYRSRLHRRHADVLRPILREVIHPAQGVQVNRQIAKGRSVMYIEIDLSNLDEEAVNDVVLALADALNNDNINPTVEEVFAAIGIMIQAIIDEASSGWDTMH